jgi:hypothetical protein
MPTSEKAYSKKTVNDSRQIITQAWIGRGIDEQRYECIIKFGKYALRRYAKGTNLKGCIPGRETTDWVELDIEKKTIVVRLL